MLGHSHALSGLAAGAAALPVAPVTGWVEQVAWVAAWGGFAMLPDLDQAGATISRMWGPISNVAARAVGAVSGGHRNGTHSIIGMVVIALLCWLTALHPVGQVALLAVGIGLALRACHFVIPGSVETTIAGNLLLSWGGAWWLTTHGHTAPTWLPAAVLAGCVVHVLGDMLTRGGVPLAWPVSDSRQALSLFKTGARVETALLAPAFCIIAAWLLYRHTDAHEHLGPVLAAVKGAA